MSKTLRASFSLNESSFGLLRLIADCDLRSMSGELRFLIRERANEVLANGNCGEDMKVRILEMLKVVDETDAD